MPEKVTPWKLWQWILKLDEKDMAAILPLVIRMAEKGTNK